MCRLGASVEQAEKESVEFLLLSSFSLLLRFQNDSFNTNSAFCRLGCVNKRAVCCTPGEHSFGLLPATTVKLPLWAVLPKQASALKMTQFTQHFFWKDSMCLYTFANGFTLINSDFVNG